MHRTAWWSGYSAHATWQLIEPSQCFTKNDWHYITLHITRQDLLFTYLPNNCFVYISRAQLNNLIIQTTRYKHWALSHFCASLYTCTYVASNSGLRKGKTDGRESRKWPAVAKQSTSTYVSVGIAAWTLLLTLIYVAEYDWGQGWLSIPTRYGVEGPGIESPWGTRFSSPVQTGPGAHPASYTMDTGLYRG